MRCRLKFVCLFFVVVVVLFFVVFFFLFCFLLSLAAILFSLAKYFSNVDEGFLENYFEIGH